MRSVRSIFISILVGLVMVCTGFSWAGDPCYAPPNADGSADLPPVFCTYTPDEIQGVLDFQASPTMDSFFDIVYTMGGNFGPEGQIQQYHAVLHLALTGTGTLEGYARTVDIPIDVETHSAARGTGEVQDFDTEMVSLSGQLPPGDPDFDLLRVTAGSAFGMPSPGHTTLTQIGGPGGDWAVDSFFDIAYRIDLAGHPGGPLDGLSGTAEGTVRLSVGNPPPPPSSPVDYFGLAHTALGGATLTPGEAGLTVCCMGPSGEGGAEIDLGAAQGFQFDVEPVDWQPGARILLDATRSQDDGVLGMYFEGDVDTVRFGITNIPDTFDATIRVTLSLGNSVVATEETVKVHGDPHVLELGTVFAPPHEIGAMRILIGEEGVKPGSVTKSGPGKMNKAELIEAIAKISLRGGGPVSMSLSSGAPVLADTLSVTFSGDEDLSTSLGKVIARGSDPGHLLGLYITDQTGIWFGHAHRSLTETGDRSIVGGARLSGERRTIGAGQVTEIIKIAPPSGGGGGVAIAVGDVNPDAVGFEAYVHTHPSGAWPAGESLECALKGAGSGQNGECDFRLAFRSTDTGAVQFTLEPEDVTCLPDSIRVDVLRNGRSVATQTLENSGTGTVLIAEGDFGDVDGEPMMLRVITEEGIKASPPSKGKLAGGVIPGAGIISASYAATGRAPSVNIALPGLPPVLGDEVKVWLDPMLPRGTRIREVQFYVTGQETHWTEVVWETPIVPYPDFPTTQQGGIFETGENVCLESPAEGLSYQWFKDGEALTDTFGRWLCLENLQPSDSGVYRVVVEDGAKTLVEYYFYITVSSTVPAAGAFGLAMLAALAGVGGIAVLRRRRHA